MIGDAEGDDHTIGTKEPGFNIRAKSFFFIAGELRVEWIEEGIRGVGIQVN